MKNNYSKNISLFYYSIILFLISSCQINDDNAPPKKYDVNYEFNEFIKKEFPFIDKKTYKSIDFENTASTYSELNIQLIHFCPLEYYCHYIIYDMEQHKFLINDFPLMKYQVETLLYENQLDTTKKEHFFIIEEKHAQYSFDMLSKVLNHRYSETIIPFQKFKDLVFFLSKDDYYEVSKNDIIQDYRKTMNKKNNPFAPDELSKYQAIYKQQINYIFSKMGDTPYFIVLKNKYTGYFMIYELSIFDYNDSISRKGIKIPIKYNLKMRTYPTYVFY